MSVEINPKANFFLKKYFAYSPPINHQNLFFLWRHTVGFTLDILLFILKVNFYNFQSWFEFLSLLFPCSFSSTGGRFYFKSKYSFVTYSLLRLGKLNAKSLQIKIWVNIFKMQWFYRFLHRAVPVFIRIIFINHRERFPRNG